MKFSFVIPIFIQKTDTTRIAMLRECIKSIRMQSHSDWEVIVKNTPDDNISREWIDPLDPVSLICKPDTGITDGLNQGLQYVTGDIIHWLCGDDLLGDLDTLAFLNEQFQDNKTPQWIYSNIGSIDEFGTHRGGDHGSHMCTIEELLEHNRIGQPTVFWNRAMFEKIGYFQYTMASDYDYWCRCYRIAKPMYTEKILGIGRRWEQSASHINSELVEKEAAEISTRNTVDYVLGREPEYVSYP